MALQKQLAHIPLRGGVDTKTDARLVIPNKLSEASDVVFDDADTLRRRGGLTAETLTSVTSPLRTFPHLNDIIVEANKAWLVRSGTAPIAIDNRQMIATASQAGNPNFMRAGMETTRVASGMPYWANGTATPNYVGCYDCASDGTTSVWALEDRDVTGSGRICLRVVVQTEATKTVLADTIINDVTGSNYVYVKPRVVYCSSAAKFYLYYGRYASGGTTWSMCVRTITATSIGNESIIFTTGALGASVESSATVTCLFDAVYSTTNVTSNTVGTIGLIMYDQSATTLRFYFLDAVNGTTVRLGGVGGVSPSADPRQLTAVFSLNGSNVLNLIALYAINTNLVKAAAYNSSASTTAEATAMTCTASTKIGRIVAVDSAPGTSAGLYIGVDNSTTTAYASPVDGRSTLWVGEISKSALTNVSVTQTFSGWLIHGRLQYLRDRYWLPMMLPSALQPTVYVIDFSYMLTYAGASSYGSLGPLVLARIDYGECGRQQAEWASTRRVPSCFINSNSDTITVPYSKWERNYLPVNNLNGTPVALARADIDYASQLGHAEVNGLTYLAGACPHMFDGLELVEENFHHAPDLVSVTVGAGTTYPVGTFGLCYTMTWKDAQGNWHESAPSTPLSVTTTVGNRNLTVVVISPPTQKASAELVEYRTAVGGTTYYRSVGLDGTALTDAQLVASGPLVLPVQANEILYTSEGRVPNEPMPACRAIAVHQGRLVGIASDNATIFYSKTAIQGYAPGFNAEFTARVPPDYGRGVACASIDGKLILLAERKIGVLLGDGDNDLGAGGNLTAPQLAVGNYGLRYDSPKGVTVGPEGVWFASRYGVRLLGNDLNIAEDQAGKDVGSEVDSILSTAVAPGSTVRYSVTVVQGAAATQIRFYKTALITSSATSDSQCVVWDGQFKQFSYFTNHAHIDAVFATNRFYHLTSAPSLRYYDETAQLDVGTSITGTFATAWLEFGGIQGFQRVYRLMLTGQNLDELNTPQTISVSAGYDFETQKTTLVAASEVGVVSARGSIQVQHHLVRQKCTSLQLKFTFVSDLTRLRVTELTLAVGLKKGLNKVPSGQRI